MSAWRFVVRSLVVHWRMNFAVALGVAAATAVLTGALLVGDSMRASLRQLAVERLGRIDQALLADHFFREELAEELAAAPGFGKHFQETHSAVLLFGTVEHAEQGRRAGRVTVLGCTPDFWSLDEVLDGSGPALNANEVVLNQPLADQLQANVDDQVILRIGQLNQIPADSPMGRNTAQLQSRRLRVSAIVPAEGIGRFALTPSQHLPLNAFLAKKTLQDLLDRPDRVNALLVAGREANQEPSSESSQFVRRFLRPVDGPCGPTLDDLGLELTRNRLTFEDETILDYFSLSSDELILRPGIEEAAQRAWGEEGLQPAFTYLANNILAGDGKARIPYSSVTAIDSTPELGPVLDEQGKPLRLQGDEMVLNQWAADDLAAQRVPLEIGDPIQISYFEPESTHGEEVERTVTFRLRAIAPLAEPGERPELANDAGLTPETPGLTDKESIDNWDPPFPYDEKRVRTRPPNDQDEQYWDKHRLTPKAFISLAAGRMLWESRFGRTTSLRVPARGDLDRSTLAQQLRAQLDPEKSGMTLLHVKRDSLEAAQGTTSFSGLFLGFSFFIIAAAVMLATLLFRLGVEQRAAQVGLLLAVGFRERRVATLFGTEGALVAVSGGVLGLLLGVGYAWLMLAGLRTWWLDAVVTPFLALHVSVQSLAIGLFSGILVCLATIIGTLRGVRRVPVRRLLSGQMQRAPTYAGRRRWTRVRIVSLVLAAISVLSAAAATKLSGEAAAGCFFCSGGAILSAALLLIWSQFSSTSSGSGPVRSLGIFGLALRNAGRNPGRSTLTIGLVASASFLIVAISAFRLAPSEQGAGGFDLMAESTQPIVQDLNTTGGRSALGFEGAEEKALSGCQFASFRVKEGDDASCLNLYKPRQPRVLGVPQTIVERYANKEAASFAWAESAAVSPEEQQNPWLLLDRPVEDNVVPVVLDKNTAMYSMHLFTMKGSGTEFEIEFPNRDAVRFRIVGLLSNSIFQGSLLIGESNFRDLFPDVDGYRFFLVDAPKARLEPTLATMEDRLGDFGFDAEMTSSRLEQLLAVQNTYLSTFQSLGALGLLLGTFGLATVQLRNVFERRGELALLRAAGFRRRRLAQMIMLENMVLLAGGLTVGITAALVAVLPQSLSNDVSIPVNDLVVMLATILAVGLATGLAAIRSTTRAPLLSALRGE